MHKPQGYAVAVDSSGKKVLECDTITCNHCNTVVLVKPKADPAALGGFCRMCMKHICPKCTDKQTCTPFEKRLQQIESKDRLRKAVGV